MTDPVLKVKDYPFSVAFFEKTKDGNTYYQVALSRNYKDNNGDWKSQTINIFPQDLLKIANISQRAYNSLLTLQSKKAQKSTPQPAPADENFDDDIPF